MLRDVPSLLWEFTDKRGRHVECTVRLLHVGIQVEISVNHWPLIARVFPESEGATTWAEEERALWGTDECDDPTAGCANALWPPFPMGLMQTALVGTSKY